MTNDPFENGVLDEEKHRRLVADADYYARLAGVRREWLWEPLTPHTGTIERSWISSYRTHREKGVQGLLYVGAYEPSVLTRMRALTGALVRNFIDARLRSLAGVCEPDEEARRCSVLLVPDLFMGEEASTFHARSVGPLLMERAALEKQTVVYVSDAEKFGRVCGKDALRLVSTSYVRVAK